MLRIDGEQKRQGRLHLRVAHGQFPGRAGPICKYTVYTQDQNTSSDTYIYICGNPTPAVRLDGLAPLTNYNISDYVEKTYTIDKLSHGTWLRTLQNGTWT